MNIEFANKKVLTIGSSQGIGKSIVDSFLIKNAQGCGISRRKKSFWPVIKNREI
jgi:short-subunit dehydrogenase